MNAPRILRWLLLPLAAFVADVASKAWILALLPREGATKVVIPGFFNLTLGFNKGAIFGTLQGAPDWLRVTLFTLAGLGALWYFGREFLSARTPTLERVALGLILGGAAGNGLDRLLRGHVVDFLDFVFRGWHYWTFNIADSCIVVGGILFGVSLLRPRKVQEPTAAD
jgi:signal peptidase II